MATVLPSKPLEKIQFCENRVAGWATNATAIGTTTTAVTDLTTKTTAARAAFEAHQAAQIAAKDASLTYQSAVRTMATAAADVIKSIKAKAAVTGDSVYALASIPAPSAPSPVPPPGQPQYLKATIDPSGALELSWKCANPPGAVGTIYQISRQDADDAPFVIIGASGRRKFVDAGVPSGVTKVTYRIVALRSTIAGPLNEFTVKFGGAAGGGFVASVVSAPKLAA